MGAGALRCAMDLPTGLFIATATATAAATAYWAVDRMAHIEKRMNGVFGENMRAASDVKRAADAMNAVVERGKAAEEALSKRMMQMGQGVDMANFAHAFSNGRGQLRALSDLHEATGEESSNLDLFGSPPAPDSRLSGKGEAVAKVSGTAPSSEKRGEIRLDAAGGGDGGGGASNYADAASTFQKDAAVGGAGGRGGDGGD
jgi:hypothetical protein